MSLSLHLYLVTLRKHLQLLFLFETKLFFEFYIVSEKMQTLCPFNNIILYEIRKIMGFFPEFQSKNADF